MQMAGMNFQTRSKERDLRFS
ncbi:hypothetical protein [uncultured Robinsoniella sp.]